MWCGGCTGIRHGQGHIGTAHRKWTRHIPGTPLARNHVGYDSVHGDDNGDKRRNPPGTPATKHIPALGNRTLAGNCAPLPRIMDYADTYVTERFVRL